MKIQNGTGFEKRLLTTLRAQDFGALGVSKGANEKRLVEGLLI
jgi:hypothetical protein